MQSIRHIVQSVAQRSIFSLWQWSFMVSRPSLSRARVDLFALTRLTAFVLFLPLRAWASFPSSPQSARVVALSGWTLPPTAAPDRSARATTTPTAYLWPAACSALALPAVLLPGARSCRSTRPPVAWRCSRAGRSGRTETAMRTEQNGRGGVIALSLPQRLIDLFPLQLLLRRLGDTLQRPRSMFSALLERTSRVSAL